MKSNISENFSFEIVNKSLNNNTSLDVDYMYPNNTLVISFLIVSKASYTNKIGCLISMYDDYSHCKNYIVHIITRHLSLLCCIVNQKQKLMFLAVSLFI